MRSFVRPIPATAVALAGLLLIGCSSSAPAANAGPAPSAPAGPPAVVTAKAAFSPLYKSALAWSSDVELLHVAPVAVSGFTNADGKAAAWQAAFASPSKHQLRLYTYSIATVPPDIHKGTDGGIPIPWAGVTRDSMPIDLSVFSVDSDAAYQAASADAAPWIAKNPAKTLTSLELGATYRFPAPFWYAQWGDKKSGTYIAVIDATSGKVYKGK